MYVAAICNERTFHYVRCDSEDAFTATSIGIGGCDVHNDVMTGDDMPVLLS
jgi:hypothetical protein